MTKKRLLVVFLTVLTILTMAVSPIMTGCAKPAPAPTPAPSPAPAPTEPIELRWTAGSQGLTTGCVPGRGCLKLI
jgi:hypothetical protein